MLAFAVLWVGILAFLARLSGWHSLAQEYATDLALEGQRWRFCSAQMRNLTNYSGVLTFAVSPKGLGITTFYPFRIGHSPLLIPWEVLSVSSEKKLFFSMIRLQAIGIPIYVWPSLADQLKIFAGDNWPLGD